MELLPSSLAMRALLSLRSPDTYNPLMVQSIISPVFNGDDLPQHAACILLGLPSIAVDLSQKLAPPPWTWFRHGISVDPTTTTLTWLRIRDVIQFLPIVFAFYLPLHSSKMNVFKPERIDRDQYSLVSLCNFFICVICFNFCFSPTSVVMRKVLEYEPI